MDTCFSVYNHLTNNLVTHWTLIGYSLRAHFEVHFIGSKKANKVNASGFKLASGGMNLQKRFLSSKTIIIPSFLSHSAGVLQS